MHLENDAPIFESTRSINFSDFSNLVVSSGILDYEGISLPAGKFDYVRLKFSDLRSHSMNIFREIIPSGMVLQNVFWVILDRERKFASLYFPFNLCSTFNSQEEFKKERFKYLMCLKDPISFTDPMNSITFYNG